MHTPAPLPDFPRCDEVPAWAALHHHFETVGRHFDLRQAFATDPGRFEAFSQEAAGLFADLSRHLLDAPGEALLLDLARQCRLPAQRDAMFRGDRLNNTEQRAVMHWLLRYPHVGAQWAPAGIDDLQAECADVARTLDAMLAYAEQVRADTGITDVVNIGIGGSDLGPQMATLALEHLAAPGRRLHFVSNVDGHELASVLRGRSVVPAARIRDRISASSNSSQAPRRRPWGNTMAP